MDMRKAIQALMGMLAALVLSAGSCLVAVEGDEDQSIYAFRIGPDLNAVARDRGFDPREWTIEKRVEDGSWVGSVGFSSEAVLDYTFVENDCSTLGDMRLVEPESGHVFVVLPAPVCFTGPALNFVITLDMVEWP